jgi:type II secretion system protein I
MGRVFRFLLPLWGKVRIGKSRRGVLQYAPTIDGLILLPLSRNEKVAPHPSQGAGYSLIEILVAFAIFSIAAVALTSGVTTVIRSSNESEHLTQATILAQDKLEALSAQVTPLSGGNDTPRAGFTRVWTVTPGSPQAGVTRLDVTVSWTDYLPHTVTLTTAVNK